MVTSKLRHPETFHSKPKWFGGIQILKFKKQLTWQHWCLVLVPWPYCLCHGIAFCAAMMFFVPWHCALHHGNALHAAAKLFVLQQSSLCHGKALHAMAKLSCCGKARCAMAMLFVLQQQMMHHDIAWHHSFCCGSCHGKK